MRAMFPTRSPLGNDGDVDRCVNGMVVRARSMTPALGVRVHNAMGKQVSPPIDRDITRIANPGSSEVITALLLFTFHDAPGVASKSRHSGGT